MKKSSLPFEKTASLDTISSLPPEGLTADEAKSQNKANLKAIYDLHYTMYAEDKQSLLIILQGIDASGKDGSVRHLCTGLNPQGFHVYSFKTPTTEETRHDYLWRVHKVAPAHGEIVICNRSYYEEVTVVKIHPEFLVPQKISAASGLDEIFERRYRQINDFERMLAETGTRVLKFFLHISKKEQKKRLEERLRNPMKKWKFSEKDVAERAFWSQYMQVFDEMLAATHTEYAPWYVIPADKKWYRNYLLGQIVRRELESFRMEFPKPKLGKVKLD
ncbi:protein of unknown function DUF344 [Chloroherpeton thalassium ATCC 35110]|uniref:Polyphosphate kinase-2-related domain-containing protein n=1 Tax=Chloroherpeton thalassium (strain ATCC 35110 / GB-78) TaxID=517418 RepID=B3QU28_CHLT3|nr:PPK2 family polyphosphate kinase [Chloroherpeton thalassium]ACF12826.1 protein of unknown function DUF344 [Chloroherpeton thalassium ATCC 35110]